MHSYRSFSLVATRQIAKTKVWSILLKKKSKQAVTLTLVGDLGSGKTTLTRSLLRVLGVKGRVTSPTFTLIRRYRLRTGLPFQFAFHIDCYRLKKPEELLVLGFKEIISNPKNLVIIEWPELMKKYLPRDTVRILLEHGKNKNERRIRL